MKKLLRNFLKFRHDAKKYGSSSSAHWSYYNRWKKTLDPSKSSLHYRLPWITFQSIAFLEKELKKDQTVFEFGGGGSSLFFLEKGCRVTTVEHDDTWFREMAKCITENKFDERWKGHFITEEQQVAHKRDPSDPSAYFSSHKDYGNVTFKSYASKIDEAADNSIDLVLVDGRVRPSCIWHAIPKLKQQGLLVIDNTERDYYSDYFLKHFAGQFTLVLDDFGPVPYITWFNKTTIWRKN